MVLRMFYQAALGPHLCYSSGFDTSSSLPVLQLNSTAFMCLESTCLENSVFPPMSLPKYSMKYSLKSLAKMKGRIWWCCNPNSWKVEVGGSQVQGQPRLHQETDAVKKKNLHFSHPLNFKYLLIFSKPPIVSYIFCLFYVYFRFHASSLIMPSKNKNIFL